MYHLTVLRQSLANYDTLYQQKGYYLIDDTTKIAGKSYSKLGLLHTHKKGAIYSFIKIE
jgi:hypothetical protein